MNRVFIAALMGMAFAAPAQAVTIVDGVVLITQADALAGGVTAGDTPGFPVTLSATGSYRLASNLQTITNVNGFNVTAAEVTIDLAGFRLSGGGVGAIGISGLQRGLVVKDGTIRRFLLDGVRTRGSYLVVSNVVITENGRTGVVEDTAGPVGFARIIDSTIVRNAAGVFCVAACHVESSNVSFNTGNGVTLAGDGGLLLGNTIFGNGQFGIFAQFLINNPLSVAFGNNAIFANGSGPTSGTTVELQPNACGPQAC